MISYKDLHILAINRLADARVLYNKERYNGALYICGYANEFELKAVICKKLKLRGIPNENREFKLIKDVMDEIKVHDLEKLMALLKKLDSKYHDKFIRNKQSDWSQILGWHPSTRYYPIGKQSRKEQKLDAGGFIKATSGILKFFQIYLKVKY